MQDWRERLSALTGKSYSDYDSMMKQYMTAGANDAGFTGPDGNGSIFVRENGTIDMFAKEGLGISIDPELNSISIFANDIKLYSSNLDVYTNPLSWKWNKQPLNLQVSLFGEGVGAVTVTPGTLMPYNTGMTDASAYGGKVLGMMA